MGSSNHGSWKKIPLGDVASLQRGHDLPDAERKAGNVPIMGSFGVTGTHSIAKVKGPGVTIGRSGGSIGVVSYIESDYWPLNTCLYVTDFHGNNPLYVYYLLKTLDLASLNSGSAQPSLNRNFVHPIPVNVPEPDEQEQIVNLLSILDRKIKLNHRMNETLEAMAQALFKSWFVDFDPVKAKAEGRKPEGIDDVTASLFPVRFHDGIPEGWSIKSVSEAIQLNPSEKLPNGMEAPYLDMAALPTRGCVPDPPVLRVFSSGTKFRNGDTLLARITPCLENGKTAYIAYLQDDQVAWGSTEFIVMRSKSPLPAEYTYLLARDKNFRAHAIQSMTGTSGRQRVQTDTLGTYKICIPTDRVAQKFGQILHPIFMKIVALSRESNTLSQLRYALLPRLISGKLRVSEESGPS